MYGENEGRPSFQADTSGPPSPGIPIAGPGQAIEVVEMANGEVIWNVVDAMRGDLGIEDDIASLYQNRLSTNSEYSMRMSEDSSNRDNMQIFFKEHKRGGSKGSAASGGSRRLLLPSNGNRPETKVRTNPVLIWLPLSDRNCSYLHLGFLQLRRPHWSFDRGHESWCRCGFVQLYAKPTGIPSALRVCLDSNVQIFR